jgi:hypothetical protein
MEEFAAIQMSPLNSGMGGRPFLGFLFRHLLNGYQIFRSFNDFLLMIIGQQVKIGQ